jgi:hypothetical protein
MVFFVVTLACFSQSNFGEGSNSPSNESYQWGSTPVQDGTDTSVSDTALSNEESQIIGYSVGNKAPNLYSTDQSGSPWSLYEQNTSLVVFFGHMDTTALPLMLEQVSLCNSDILLGILIGRSIYSSPATTADANDVLQQYNLSFALVDSTQSLVNEWSQRTPPKAYLISAENIILWSGFQTIDCNIINQLSEDE